MIVAAPSLFAFRNPIRAVPVSAGTDALVSASSPSIVSNVSCRLAKLYRNDMEGQGDLYATGAGVNQLIRCSV